MGTSLQARPTIPSPHSLPLYSCFLPSLPPSYSLLSQLPEMFSNNKTPQVILEPVVRAGMEALKAAGRSGRLFVFHSSLPTAQGPGTLKNRVDSKLLGTEKEKASVKGTPLERYSTLISSVRLNERHHICGNLTISRVRTHVHTHTHTHTHRPSSPL